MGNEGQTDRLLYDIYARNETVDQSDDQIQTFDTGGSGDSDSGSISTTSIQQNAAGDDDGEDDEDQNFEEDNDSDTEGGTSENTGNSTDPNSNQDSADQNDLNSTEINGNSSSESENNVTGAFTAQNPGAFGLLLLLILLLSAIGYYRNEIGAQIRSVNPL